MNKKIWLYGAVAALLAMNITADAFAADTYVFPSAGFRYTQQEGETVLTHTNLGDHTEFIESLGTTADAVAASYNAAGISMEVYTADGSQLSVSTADASGYTEAREAADLDDAGKSALLTRFQESGLYTECRWSEGEPDWLVLTSSAMYGSMPVWQLRYVTLHLGSFYTVTDTIVGREPADADEQTVLTLVRGIKLLNMTSAPTASPTPMPTATPEPAAEATPVPAQVNVKSGSIQLDDVVSVVNSKELVLTGTADPSEKITVTEEGKTIGTVTSGKDGRFTVKVTLAQTGENLLEISGAASVAEVTVTCQDAPAKLTITEPDSFTFTGDRILLRGVTEPNATVYANGYKTNTNVKANKNGVYSLPIFIYEEGTYDFTIRAHLRGKTDTEMTVTLTRELTDREKLAAFKQAQVPVTYEALAADPEAYAGKNYAFRGKVMAFTDYDGSPCALVCVNNKQAGVWTDPVYAVLSVDDAVNVGDVLTFYLVGEGITLPAAGDYTASGTETEAPVGRVFSYTSGR